MGEPVNAGAGSGGSDRVASVQAKVDELGSLYRKVAAARSANRTARVVVVIAVLVVVLTFGVSLIMFFVNYDRTKFMGKITAEQGTLMNVAEKELRGMGKALLPVYQEELKNSMPAVKERLTKEWASTLEDLKKEWEPTVLPQLKALEADLKTAWGEVQKDMEGELNALMKDMQTEIPAIRQQIEDQANMFKDQFQKDWPGMQSKLEEQADLFVKNVQDKSQQMMQVRIQGILTREQDKVVAAFPDLKDEQKRGVVMQNLQTALETAVRSVMSQRVATGKDRIARLYSKVLNFLPAERRAEFPQRITTAWDVLIKKYQTAAPTLEK